MEGAGEIVATFEALKNYQYAIVSTVCLVTFEYLVNFDNEIRYLWQRRFTFASALLFLCRYLPFASALQVYVFITTTDLNPSRCISAFRASGCLIYVQFLLSTLVLFTRSYAVWGRAKKVLAVFSIVFAGTIAGTSYSMYAFTWAATPIALPGVSRGCLMQYANNDLWMALPILIFCEALALGLLLVKSVQHCRATKNLRRRGANESILVVMARDGIGYFTCSIAISIASFVVIKYITSDDFLFILQGAVQAILCSRLLCHVYAVNDNDVQGNLSAIRVHQSDDYVRRSQLTFVPMTEISSQGRGDKRTG